MEVFGNRSFHFIINNDLRIDYRNELKNISEIHIEIIAIHNVLMQSPKEIDKFNIINL